MIVSDHNPQDVETKRLPFAEAADGAIGLETLLSAALRLVHDGPHVAAAAPRARCRRGRRKSSGCPPGGLRPARRPISSLFDPDEPYVLDKRDLRSRSKNTPFDEARLQGQVPPDAGRPGRIVYRWPSERDVRGSSRMPESMNWSLAAPYFAAAFAIGYLLGSIPFGLLLTRFAGLGDIRKLGSGNIGATNVLRTGRKGLAAATLVGDALKGTAAVLLIAAGSGDRMPRSLPALGAFLGHLFPVWLGFKGGKGVATFLGCLLGLKPVAVARLRGDLARGRLRSPATPRSRRSSRAPRRRSCCGGSASARWPSCS